MESICLLLQIIRTKNPAKEKSLPAAGCFWNEDKKDVFTMEGECIYGNTYTGK